MAIADHLIRPQPAHRAMPRADALGATVERVDLLDVPEAPWRDLVMRAAEPNAFYHPDWARAVARHADGKSGAQALLVWDGPQRAKLVALLPVVSAWRTYRLPVPALVAWQAYAPLTTPLVDRDAVTRAARGLVQAARDAGALALVLPFMAADSALAEALRAAGVLCGGVRERNSHQRARLDATQAADAAIASLSAKKLKEWRRQRKRLADEGAVTFRLHGNDNALPALDAFLALESAGWKGARGTALAQSEGDRRFVREAVPALIRSGHAQIATLNCGDRIVAAGLILRHLSRGYFFKVAYDECDAKASPGVQLTLDLTRAVCDDVAISDMDSLAVADHPMIDHLWRGKLTIADMIVPLQRDAFAFGAIVLAMATRETLRNLAKRAVQVVRRMRGR
jgi:CelD/BcsL family acetyltransferase involved in cellulose biosynthesis